MYPIHCIPIKSVIAAISVIASIGLVVKGIKKTKIAGEIPIAYGNLPYFGHMLQFKTGEIQAITMAKWHRDLGPIIRVNMGVKPWVVVADPHMAHEILSINGIATSNRPSHTYANRIQSSDHGIVFNNPSARWKKARGIASQMLSPKHVSTLDALLLSEADFVVDKLIHSSTDIIRHLQLSTLNVAMSITFGKRVASIDDPFFVSIIEVIEMSIKHADPADDKRAFLPYYYSLIDLVSQKEAKLNQFLTEVRDPVYHQLIQEALESDKDCYAKRLYESKDEDIDDETVLNACFDAIVAGTDTTAITLAWAMIILCNHPDVQKSLQTEIDTFIQTHDGRLPTFAEMDELPLLVSAQKECMRMRPISPLGLPRQAMDDVACCGYAIPRGTTICSNIYAIHHDPKRYPDPYTFKADRFIDKPRAMSTLSKAKVDERDQFAFGWGRRTCPGSHLAEVEMFNIWVRLLARATIEPKLDENGHAVFPDIDAYVDGGAVMIPAQTDIRVVQRQNAHI
ncbi:cytochrome P450 [Dichotomocladium elegans]|nr:cytochrome P450 [Dichotomocladium elegans]